MTYIKSLRPIRCKRQRKNKPDAQVFFRPSNVHENFAMRSEKTPAARGWFSSWLSPPFTYMVAKSGRKHQCAKMGFTDLTEMVSCECIRLSMNSEGFPLHLFPLRSPNRTPISEKYYEKEKKPSPKLIGKGCQRMH